MDILLPVDDDLRTLETSNLNTGFTDVAKL